VKVNRSAVKVLVLVAALSFGLLIGAPAVPRVRAWGLATHMWMVDQAIAAMPDGPWKDAFEFFSAEVKSGAVTPDMVWQDWDNHLYYPETGEKTAHLAVERWFGYMRGNLSIGAWEEGMFAAGVLSHYFSDPNIPVHTDSYWPGHSALEADINVHLSTFTLDVGSPELVDDPRQLLIDYATYAHQFFDDCHTLYPTGDIPDPSPLDANATFYDIIETQLERAVFGFRNLWYTAVQGLEAPKLPKVTASWTILIDAGHDNAYTGTEDKLSSFKAVLSQLHINVIVSEGEFTPDNLTGIDLLVITAPFREFSASEISCVADWLVNGTGGHMIVTGYSDYYSDFKRDAVNWLLGNCTSHIRLTDDQVCDASNDPKYWYLDIDSILPPQDTFNITKGVSSFRMYSACSLWFDGSGLVNVTVYGDPNFYQKDNGGDPPEVVYDDTNDGVGGDSIPLMAVEQIGDSRILVSGTTFFSDYDYGVTEYFDNDVFVENALEWLLGAELEKYDVAGPTISDVTVTPEQPAPGQGITITATAEDEAGVDNVTLYYQVDGGEEQAVDMTSTGGNTYQGVIPASAVAEPCNVTFYLRAYDTLGNWRKTVATTIYVSATATTSTPPPSLGLPVIVAVAVSAAIIVVIVVLAIWLLHRRKRVHKGTLHAF